MSLNRRKASLVAALFGFFLLPSALLAQPFQVGEKITYDIQKLKVSAGKATLEFKGPAKINGENLVEIIFTSKGMKFLDIEKIYVEPETFLPVRVERDLNIFGKVEQITEEYDKTKGFVKITKLAGGKTTAQTIEKGSRLDNIYGFLYRYRQNGNFKIGDTIKLNLPTKDVTIKLIKQYEIGAAGKTYNAFFMQSEPRKYSIWFDASPQKLPLRIDGAVGMGKTTMILEKVENVPQN